MLISASQRNVIKNAAKRVPLTRQVNSVLTSLKPVRSALSLNNCALDVVCASRDVPSRLFRLSISQRDLMDRSHIDMEQIVSSSIDSQPQDPVKFSGL
jgi:hypothetical protein